jgi:hypothetical protein
MPLRSAALTALSQGPPERFGVGQQHREAVLADGEAVVTLASYLSTSDGGQFGGLATAVARLDDEAGGRSFHTRIVADRGMGFKVGRAQFIQPITTAGGVGEGQLDPHEMRKPQDFLGFFVSATFNSRLLYH